MITRKHADMVVNISSGIQVYLKAEFRLCSRTHFSFAMCHGGTLFKFILPQFLQGFFFFSCKDYACKGLRAALSKYGEIQSPGSILISEMGTCASLPLSCNNSLTQVSTGLLSNLRDGLVVKR